MKHFVKLELKELKLWQKILDEKIWQEILKLRRKVGAEKARITRRENPPKPKDDPLLEVIRNDIPSRLSYYHFDELKRERFFSLLPEWLKASDRVKSAIFETPYVKELNEQQYLQVFKSWLKDSYGYMGIECLKLETLRKLDADEWYHALEKFLNNRIEKIEPLPTLDEVKQRLLPKLLSNNDDTEEVYLKYKEKMLRGEIEKFKKVNSPTEDFFSAEEIKKVKTIIAAFDRYSPDNDELKLKTDFYEFALSLPEGRKEALCRYLSKPRS
ncbi:MAG TPA: hypothetical protein DHV62_07075 [Elusimicrobia bacterium]|nr:hypothetical protein [Elusimicrobiota bacterium]